MPRFALLNHDHPRPHFDLLLEVPGVLWTWRLDKIPSRGEGQAAERIQDHRLVYLDYEGPVSGNRGRVVRVAQGTFRWLTQEENLLRLHLEGDTLNGLLTLRLQTMPWWCLLLEQVDLG